MGNTNLPAEVSAVDAIEMWLDTFPAMDIDEVSERTLARTLSATTMDDVLRDPTGTGIKTLDGDVLTILEVVGVLDSEFESRFRKYVVLDVMNETTGEKMTVTGGGDYVLSRVFQAYKLGALPFRARVLCLESRSHPGRTSVWLVKP